MADKLAGLVLPDKTPLETAADPLEYYPGQRQKVPPSGVARPRETPARFRGNDWLLAAGGALLAGICAIFPWYIFLHQESFGIRPFTLAEQPKLHNLRPGLRDDEATFVMPNLDFVPTGTVPETPEQLSESLYEQPFPGDRRKFRLIAAENGRAMIEDDDGFWMVQPGSLLPDGSRVSRVERRAQTWVLVTSADTEIQLSR
ncbi:hypothetical protein [Chelativorans sp. Marseille-P2723]|uniref:hypothetical protein n=1 Tax=Chelativorans sp. Marseille-P2723 TaxID=2709133 RepID=UPI00156F05F9|nr:hypothetical protein [Chelativorans sp. Marseille-P2723]